jgi:hypothetical protein
LGVGQMAMDTVSDAGVSIVVAVVGVELERLW